jgi:ubiquinone/menaquinone biosynthesis C-methylase UbiE
MKENIDPRIQNEIDQGEFLTSRNPEKIWNWTSPAGIERFKRRANMLTEKITRKMVVLEIGCGTGLLTQEIVKTGAEIYAIDISPQLLDIAVKSISESNVHFQIQNAYQLDYPDDLFDAVVGSSTLHHLDTDKALKEFHRVLKPGGLLLFTEPNMVNPQIFIERKLRILFKHISPDETAFIREPLTQKLKKSGFYKIKIYPFDWLHPAVPRPLIRLIKYLGGIFEMTPFLKEFSGSLYIFAQKG